MKVHTHTVLPVRVARPSLKRTVAGGVEGISIRMACVFPIIWPKKPPSTGDGYFADDYVAPGYTTVTDTTTQNYADSAYFADNYLVA